MKLLDQTLAISPTDLAYFLACRHRTALELSVAHGVRQRPETDDPMLEALFALGLEHEKRYVDSLAASGLTLIDLSNVKGRDALVMRTTEAMKAGADAIVQGALAHDEWFGKPDVIVKVDRPSPTFGAWSYEIADTKLAKETRGGTILQLGLYCEMLEAAQGVAPAEFHVVVPGADAARAQSPEPSADARKFTRKSYRVSDYAAYFRLLKSRLESAVELGYQTLADQNYPEPVEHCDICPWSGGCWHRRRKDDHLSRVAGISRMQRRELEPHGILTVESLAKVGTPFPFKPSRGSIETYERVRDQARLQIETRKTGQVAYELIAPSAETGPSAQSPGPSAEREPEGLARLPEPSAGDVFLDLEGDPLAAASGAEDVSGREYLFGIVTIGDDGEPEYRAWWADDAAGERRAFEEVVDLIMARWQADPGMHVYHYAPYEASAFKRLMGRYATREEQIDRLLRARRFVDLYAVVRQGVRVGVEKYSIKNLEPLYDFARTVELRDASHALRTMEQALELDRPALATPAIRAAIEGYNRDDCVSTLRLRDWLEARRQDLIDQGHPIARPLLVEGDPRPELDDKAKAVEALRQRLLALAETNPVGSGFSRTTSPEPSAKNPEPREPSAESPEPAPASPEFTLAYLLDFHRREDKAGWWEYYRLRELPEDDLFEEPRALAGLEFVAEVQQIKRSVVLRFGYPEQEADVRRKDTLNTQDGKSFGEVVATDRDARTVDIKVGPSRKDGRPTALFAHDHVSADVIEKALFALGERAADAGGVQQLPPSPARDLLLRASPRLSSGAFDPPPPNDAQASTSDYAVGIVTRLDRTVLPIQGPPGTGKTYTGARMIAALLAAGRKVGVTGPSHKVIENLLRAVAEQCPDAKLGHRRSSDDSKTASSREPRAERPAPAIERFAENAKPLAALEDDDINVLGGTAWLWARPEYAGAVDVLFVDEAGQMSLANTLGVSAAGASMVLLGDPQQLDQPTQGSHPDGVGLSALEHILDGEETMPRARGLFLPVTWRLAPAICRFTSEMFYAGQLHPRDGLDRQVLRKAGPFDGAGLYLAEVAHEGNRNASDEEAETVARILAELLDGGAEWVDAQGKARRLTPEDVRVVAPFNAHVTRIRETFANFEVRTSKFEVELPKVPVGTVDKFQGQEAPVVIYTMASSTPEDAPRGLRFLYGLNRLNVATSRARCAAIVVASPKLFEPDCRTPAQMRLANALCRFRELARQVRLDAGVAS